MLLETTRTRPGVDGCPAAVSVYSGPVGPYGLVGGDRGGTAKLLIESKDGTRTMLPSKSTFEAHPGEKIIIQTAGGGGWGNSRKRDPEKVRLDVKQGLISANRAKEAYGVEIDPDTFEIDHHRTRELRRRP